jgi:DNA-directed RNA polymerase specialized sigma24 family protein
MNNPTDFLRKKFGPLKARNLKNAIAHQITTEFPRIGGPRICSLCAEMIMELVSTHMRSRDHIKHGQVLWAAIDIKDPPRRRRSAGGTNLVPVLLDLSTADDVQQRIDRLSRSQRLLQRARRLCQQAYEQGGLLSNCDIAEMLHVSSDYVGQLLAEHERSTKTIIPRRATLHDVGSGITHKRIICWWRYVRGESPEVVARKTYHSLEAVDRYLGQYDRVRHCRLEGLTLEQTAHALNCSVRLVRQYLDIDDLLANKKKKKRDA